MKILKNYVFTSCFIMHKLELEHLTPVDIFETSKRILMKFWNLFINETIKLLPLEVLKTSLANHS